MTESLTVADYAAKLTAIAKDGGIELNRSKGPNGETIIQSADVNALAGLLAAKVDLSASILKPHIDEWKAARVI
jgi:fructose-1,6-bisphosphatase/sedoheptulose 1,7-bisphosphatase-like protein